MGESWSAQREHAHSETGLPQMVDSNPAASCCEPTAITTVLPSKLNFQGLDLDGSISTGCIKMIMFS